MAEFPDGSDRISVSVGIEHWREGETTLAVGKQGKAAVTNRRSGKVTQFDGTLTAVQMDSLAGAVQGLARMSREHEPRKPGDVPLKLAWYTGDIVTGENDAFWYGDRYEIPEVNQVIRVFNQIITQVSGGAIKT